MFCDSACIRIFLFLIHVFYACPSDSVIGCGGFLKSSSASLERVTVQLRTSDNILKDETDPAPYNGYYFLPVYDKGSYIVQVVAPDGWVFSPEKVDVFVDGHSDVCSLGKDINFQLSGFSVSGQIVTRGSATGPAGVTVRLTSEMTSSKTAAAAEVTSSKPVAAAEVTSSDTGAPPVFQRTTLSTADGRFSITNVPPGQYQVSAWHATWHLSPSSRRVTVADDSVDIGADLAVTGYDIVGQTERAGRAVAGVSVLLHADFIPDSCRHHQLLPLPPAAATDDLADNASQLPPARCLAVSDSRGQYHFTDMPNARYVLTARYSVVAAEFHVSPAQMAVVVDNDSAFVADKFQILGFTVSGRVVTASESPSSGLAGVSVSLHDQQMALSDDQRVCLTDHAGYYSFSNVQPGTYTLSVQSDEAQFDSVRRVIDENSAVLSPLVAHSFSVCGLVDVANLPDHLTAGQRVVEFYRHDTQQWLPTRTDTAGKFCTWLARGDYKLRVQVTDDEARLGLHFGCSHRQLHVTSSAISDLLFSAVRVRVSGLVVCLSADGEAVCPVGMTVQLTGVDQQPSRTALTSHSDGRFLVDGVLPGEYQVSVVKPEWCWQSEFVAVSVGGHNVTDIRLVQSGWRVRLLCSHSATVHYHRADKSTHSSSSTAATATVLSGINHVCVASTGLYSFTAHSACHVFPGEPVHVLVPRREQSSETDAPATQPAAAAAAELRLDALAHLVMGSIQLPASQQQLPEDVASVSASDAAGRPLTVTRLSASAQQQQRGVLPFSVAAAAGTQLTVTVASARLIVLPPTSQSVLVDGLQCPPAAVHFSVVAGQFVAGSVAPGLAGVKITVSSDDSAEPLVTRTDSLGAYEVGPLSPGAEYNVSAQLDGYEISSVAGRRGHFTSRRLSRLAVTVMTAAAGETNVAQPLSGALISISGDAGFRDNRLTDDEGSAVYPSLTAGHVFVRPVMKEYEFTPPSQLVHIEDGQLHQLNFTGRRVSFSLLVRTQSVAGRRAMSSVSVVAAGLADCVGHIEQAISDQHGLVRLRALRPLCEYEVRVKSVLGRADSDAAVAGVRGIPASQTIRMPRTGDVQGVSLLVARDQLQWWVTVRVVLPVHLTSPRAIPLSLLLVSADDVNAPLLHSVSVTSLSRSVFSLGVTSPPLTDAQRSFSVRLVAQSSGGGQILLASRTITGSTSARDVFLVLDARAAATNAAAAVAGDELGGGRPSPAAAAPPSLAILVALLVAAAVWWRDQVAVWWRQARVLWIYRRSVGGGAGSCGGDSGAGDVPRPVLAARMKSKKA